MEKAPFQEYLKAAEPDKVSKWYAWVTVSSRYLLACGKAKGLQHHEKTMGACRSNQVWLRAAA